MSVADASSAGGKAGHTPKTQTSAQRARVVAIVKARAVVDQGAQLRDFFVTAVPAAQAFDGCVGIDVLLDANDEDCVTLVERWRSRGDLLAYREWRRQTGSGAAGAGAALMTCTPETVVYEVVQVG
jgi:quinol monooxygenase YgiN